MPRRIPLAAAVLLWPATALAHGAAADGDAPSFDPLVGGIIIAATIAYIVLARRTPRLASPFRTMAFMAGCAVFFAVLASPLHREADLYLAAHMIQHVVLVTVAPILVLAGRSDLLLVGVLPRRGRGTFARLARAALRSPLVAAAVHAVAIWAWHLPAAFDAALESETLHFLEHLSFVVTALWFWAAVLAATRRASGRIEALLAALATLIHSGILGALMAFSPRVIYAAYADEATLLGYLPLVDQQLAGLVMWVPGGALYLAAGIWIALRLLGPDVTARPSDAEATG